MAVREAIHALTAGHVERVFTTSEVVDQVSAAGLGHGRVMLTQMLARESETPEGLVVRVRAGEFRLRAGNEPPAAAGVTARDHVLRALTALHSAGRGPVSFQEIVEQVSRMGVRYSDRAVYHGLRQLLLDPASGVLRVHPRRYVLSS